jgi:hypothetical protein
MKFRPNAMQKDEYAQKISALHAWIFGEGQKFQAQLANTGTVYFNVNGVRYRVASHKPGVNYTGEVCFHAAPTRAPEIASLLAQGKKLNGRGVIKVDKA